MGKRTISEDLRNTVKANPNIQKVYFTADGNHHLNVFDQVVKSAPDPKTGRRTATKTGEKVPGGSNKIIVSSMTRNEILGAYVEVAEEAAPVEASDKKSDKKK